MRADLSLRDRTFTVQVLALAPEENYAFDVLSVEADDGARIAITVPARQWPAFRAAVLRAMSGMEAGPIEEASCERPATAAAE